MTPVQICARWWRWLAGTLAGGGVLAGIYATSWYNYLLFHSLAEMFTIVVASGVFIVFWNSRRFLDNGCFLLIGVAYLFVGLIDLLHALAFKGMGVFPSASTNLPTQLWMVARYVEAASLLGAPMLLRRRPRPYLVLAAYAGVVSILLTLVFSGRFPACYQDGHLTPFKKISEAVVCLCLLGSLGLFSLRRRELDPSLFAWLSIAIVAAIGSETAFMLYVHVDDSANLVGHLLKLTAFFLIYKAFIEAGLTKPYALLFRNLKQSEEALRESEARFRQIAETVESELAKAKDQLVRQTRLATIGQISASIAHDLRNPLAVVRNAAYLLKRRLPPDQPKWIYYLDTIDREVDAANQIITNLMEAVRAKDPAKKPVELDRLVPEIFERTRREADFRLQTHFDPVPFVVQADPVQLRQVLANLFANAIQAMGQQGEIRVEARRNEGFHVIRVEDTGPGIPENIRDQIFEPLVSGRPKGTGLGLAICRQILQRHHGAIEVVRTGSSGTTFEIRLPVE